MPNPVKAFLSHSSKDKPFVRLIAGDLKKAGCEVWMDEMDMGPGSLLKKRIQVGLHSSIHIVVCVSEHSLNSEWVRIEIDLAKELNTCKGTTILPLLFGNIPLTETIFFEKEILYIDLRRPAAYDAGMYQLMHRGMSVRADKAQAFAYLNADRKDYLVQFARENAFSTWILDYLYQSLPLRADPTERYWGYIAIAEIGGADTRERIAQLASQETDRFALRGLRRRIE